ncbi:MAG: alpha/beta fold hydrolase [Candidatus Tectomicrobia bacterium]|uniref:Alpha/beta fold hydrolase n=1 Tax=Tectimicrobiota bacterium TaxID=2528274 RepID=A0A932MMV9_UNCTE|nr:alpha/beta fold hydrolase [Candidatus Tectomicrobia bacterium]
MPVVRSGGVDIDYEVVNPGGKGIPVFLISGLGGARAAWAAQAADFSQGRPLVLHDHRGTGKSGKPKGAYSVRLMAEDVLAVMDALRIPRAHLVGSSTGGAINQALCIDHPDRVQSAAIVSSWPRSDAFFKRQFAMRKKVLLELGWEAYTKLSAVTLNSPKFLNDHLEEFEKKEAEAIRAAPPAEVMAERIDCIMAHDEWDRLGRIKAPVLVLVARDDATTPLYYSEQLARLIPGAELRVFEEGGHLLYVPKAREFNACVLDFIRRHEPRMSASGGS